MCGSIRWFTIPPPGKGGDFTFFRAKNRDIPWDGPTLSREFPWEGEEKGSDSPWDGEEKGSDSPWDGQRKPGEVPSLPRGGDGKPSI